MATPTSACHAVTPTVHTMTLSSTVGHKSCCRQGSAGCFLEQQLSLYVPLLLGKCVKEQKQKRSISCSLPSECSAGDHTYLQILLLVL